MTTLEEAVNKLAELQENGASQAVFDFKNKFPAPNALTQDSKW